MSESAGRPTLRIVRGDPSPEEVAVITAVLTAAASGPADAGPEQLDAWGNHGRRLGLTLRPGTHAWTESGMPG